MVLHFVAAVGVLGLLTLAPGPDTAVVTRRSLVGGRADAIRAALGIVTGLLVWGSLAVLGLTALLAASATAYLVVKVIGVGYLIFLGVQALRGGKDHDPVSTPRPARGRPFVSGLVTNVSNPKIAVFYTALLPTLAPPSSGPWGLGTLVLIHAALTLSWLSGYAYALGRARDLFLRPGARRALERFTGMVLFAFAIRLATEHS